MMQKTKTKAIALHLLVALPVSSLLFRVMPSMAGQAKPTPADCWFFRNGQLEITQSCIYSGVSWAGGGVITLQWQDGVKTTIAFGLQGRGERPCPQMSVDNVCGEWRYRDPTTFEPLSDAELDRRNRNRLPALQCADVNNNSLCWHPHFNP